MRFETIFWIIFAVVIANMLFGIVKNRGFRGMMFGAAIESTVGEIPLGTRGLLTQKIKVHQLAPDAAGESRIGLELVSWTIASYQMLPIRLTASQAHELMDLLRLAGEHPHRGAAV